MTGGIGLGKIKRLASEKKLVTLNAELNIADSHADEQAIITIKAALNKAESDSIIARQEADEAIALIAPKRFRSCRL